MNEAELATLTSSSGGGTSSHLSPVTIADVVPPTSTSPVEVSTEIEPDLIHACQEGDLSAVIELLNTNNINSGALHYAASNNHWRVANYLIDNGANVNQKLEPLNATPLLWAARNGHAYMVKLLIDHGADTSVVDTSGFTALHLAVHSSNVLMVTYILHLEVPVDQLDVGHRTALHWAIVQGDHLSVEALLKSGASSNLLDGEETSPLTLAVYTSKSEYIVRMLLEYGADVSSISLVDPLPAVWVNGCELAGRCASGQPYRYRMISPEIVKVMTFLAPIVVMPLAMSMPRFLHGYLLGIPAMLLLMYYGKRGAQRYLIPYCWHGDRAFMQSNFFAGFFVSVFLSIVVFWLTQIFAKISWSQPYTTAILLVLIVAITTSYIVTMFMDPGKVEPKSMAKRLASMNRLMDRGLFDSVHLCIHTYVAIPARARYDVYLDRVICRFDHYCPWFYNSVGVRNHRAFIFFLLCLDVAMPLMARQYWAYTRVYGTTHFSTLLFIVTLVQAVWIYLLTIVQLVQITHAATSNEVTHFDQLRIYQTDPIKAFSSLPQDHPMALEILGRSTSASTLLKHTHHEGKKKSKMGIICRITGLSQMRDAMHMFQHTQRGNMADHGPQRNCMDFWLGGGNIFHPDGTMGLIDGVVVDYAKLEDHPQDV